MWVSINSLSVWYQKIPFLVFFATDWYLSLLKVKSNFPLPRLLSCNMCGVSQVLILKSFVGAISLQKCLCLTFVLLFYLCLNHILKLGAEQLYAPLDFPLIKVSCNLCLVFFFFLAGRWCPLSGRAMYPGFPLKLKSNHSIFLPSVLQVLNIGFWLHFPPLAEKRIEHVGFSFPAHHALGRRSCPPGKKRQPASVCNRRSIKITILLCRGSSYKPDSVLDHLEKP